MKTLKTLIAAISLNLGLGLASAKDVPLEGLKSLPVLEGGRVKPLDTYARVTLLQLSSKSTFKGRPAIDWLARVMFTPTQAVDDAIFRINNTDVIYALGLEPQEGSRYTFALLGPAIGKLSQLADKAMKVDEKKRTPVESEIIRVANNLSLYLGIMNSFLFAVPHSDFRLEDPATAKALGLPEREGPYSYLEVRSRIKVITALTSTLMTEGGHGKSPTAWSPEEMGAFQLAQRYDNWSEHYRSFPIHLVPPLDKGTEMWLSPWGMATLANPDARAEAALASIKNMVDAYAAGKSDEFAAAVVGFRGFVNEGGTGVFKERSIGMEILYNALDPFYRAKILYGFAILASLLSMLFFRKWLHPVGMALLGAGALLQFVGIGLRIGISGQAPVTNLFETFVFVAWTTALLGLVLEFYQRKGYGLFVGAVAAFCIMLLSGKYDNDGDTIGVLVAVLNSNFWLTTHVITISLGYAGFCLAGVVGHIWLIQAAINRHDAEKLETLDRMTYAVMAFGLVFAFIGTVLGGIWADQSWGRFWGWDPKENGALMIVLWGILIFHARPAKLIGPMGMAAGSVIGIIVVMMAWFGINLLGVGLHSYGFTSGVANALASYVGAEAVFLAVTLFVIKRSMWMGARA